MKWSSITLLHLGRFFKRVLEVEIKRKITFKKIHIFSLCFFVILIFSCRQADQTELYILGTVHFSTENVNADSIYNVLLRLRPDVIMMESDSTNFNEDFSFKKTYDENEYNAVIKYQSTFPEVRVRPIGFQGRNAYRKKIGLYPEAIKVFKELNRLADGNQFSRLEQKKWDQFAKIWLQGDSIAKSTLEVINSSYTEQLVADILRFQYDELLQIVNNREEFETNYLVDARDETISLKNYFTKWCQFEYEDRNKRMARNIELVVSKNSGQRMIVLMGFKHKAPILKILKDTDGHYLKEPFQ